MVCRQGEPAARLYVVGIGSLCVTYRFAAHTPAIEEAMVLGTLAGELFVWPCTLRDGCRGATCGPVALERGRLTPA